MSPNAALGHKRTCPVHLRAKSGHYLILSEVYLHGRKAGKA